MEISELIKAYSRQKNKILIVFLVGAFLGTVISFMPSYYQVSGSIFVGRKVQNLNALTFTYEGYYSQQNALSFSNTVRALLESHDIRFETLKNMEIEPSKRNLNQLNRKITIKNPGPQIITITVKEKSLEDAKKTWNALTNALIEKTSLLNQRGDPNITITKISDEPTYFSTKKHIIVYAISTGIFLVVVKLAITGLKIFLRKPTK